MHLKLVLILQIIFKAINKENFSVQEFELCPSKLKRRKLGQKQYVQPDQVASIQCWPIPQTVILPPDPLPS